MRKAQINHEQQFLFVLGGYERLVSGITYYMDAQFIVRFLFSFSVGERGTGREYIYGQFSEVALMDLCGQLNPLFRTGKIQPWPWLPGVEMILSAPADSN